jgi:glutamate racemase
LTDETAPISVFDSGVGGLTVLRELRNALPDDRFIYLGDTARLPYGTKSAETVARYSLQCAGVLAARGIRALVVACNTASASALPALRERYPLLPVFGVIEAGAQAASLATRRQHVAVIATEGTVNGGAYQTAIRRRSPGIRVTAQACSLFVALAEEGWVDGEIAETAARRYLAPLFAGADAPDTLVLGCTHFPLLAEAIRNVLPAGVRMVDSALTTATAVAEAMGRSTSSARPAWGAVHYLATDGAVRFARVGSNFLREQLEPAAIEIVDL